MCTSHKQVPDAASVPSGRLQIYWPDMDKLPYRDKTRTKMGKPTCSGYNKRSTSRVYTGRTFNS